MSELTKEWLLKTIAELEEERDAVPGVVNEDAEMALAAMKMALGAFEAEESVPEELEETRCDGIRKCIAALRYHHKRAETCSNGYTGSTLEDDTLKSINFLKSTNTAPALVSVPDAMDDQGGVCCEVSYADGWNSCRAAMLQGADEKPELTVWYGSMPESNGKANWTAILHRKGEGRCMDGFTIDRSEYPDRVLYAADRVRYLIGEKSERPSILDYDADAHSGYVKPGNSPAIPDGWVACSERMPNDKDYVWCWGRVVGWTEDDGFEAYYDATRNKWWAVTMDGEEPVRKVTHWQPLPSPPAK